MGGWNNEDCLWNNNLRRTFEGKPVMDICTKCEKIILSDYKFCPRCGHSLFGDPHPGGGTGMDNIRSIKFFNVAKNISNADNIDSMLGKIGNAVEELLDAERSSIMILDETGENLFFKSATGEEILKKLKIPLTRKQEKAHKKIIEDSVNKKDIYSHDFRRLPSHKIDGEYLCIPIAVEKKISKEHIFEPARS